MRKLVLLVAAAAAIVAPSMALSQELYIDRDGPRYYQPPRGYYDGPRYDNDDDGYRYARRSGRGCDPDLAIDKAADRGIRRGRIVNFSSNSVAVDGMTRRGPMRAEFYNRRGCPIIRTFYLNRY